MKSILRRLKVLLADKKKKPLLLMLYESLIFAIKKREFPSQYFGKYLYHSDVSDYLSFLSAKEMKRVTNSKKLNQYNCTVILRNKLVFSNLTKTTGLSTPRLYGHNFKNRFYSDSNLTTIKTAEELEKYFHSLFKENRTKKAFVKPMSEMGGVGCFLITESTLNKDISLYSRYLLKNDYIHQQVIDQHHRVNLMHDKCINTIRIETYIDKAGDIHILSALMRFGRGNSIVDNASAGGIYVKVDLKSGTLYGNSHQLMKYGGCQYKSHPDSDIIFDGWQIPFFDEALQLVENAVSYIPDRLIGWDIAISTDGPVIVEGNDNNSLFMSDIAFGGYLKHPKFRELLAEA